MATEAYSVDELRTKGNDLYRTGKLEEAIKLYIEASEQAQEDARPLSNLSAAYYELGDYVSAIAVSDKALPLVEGENGKQKLHIRKAKAQFHILDLGSARATAEHILDLEQKSKLLRCIAVALESKAIGHDSNAVHSRIITEIPRIKPQIRTVPEYFVFGHDMPESLYETALATTDKDKVALMFGGIGDGRHLLASLVMILIDEKMKKIDGGKLFHFTVVDHKPAVIARNIIILTMLSDIAGRGQDSRKVLFSLYYVFLAPIMPPVLHNILQKNIQRVIDVLEDRRESLEFLDLPQIYRPEVLRVLREWQHEVGAQYPPSKIRPQIARARILADFTDNYQIQKYMDRPKSESRAPPGCKKQEAFYRYSTILLLTGNGRGHGKEVQEAFDAFDVDAPSMAPEFLSYIETTWKTNPTMIDLDYEKSREHQHNDQNLCHDPFAFGDYLLCAGMAMESESGLLSYLRIYLESAADSIKHLGDRLKIEACVGDITSILEQIKYGLVGHRQPTEAPATVKSHHEHQPVGDRMEPASKPKSEGDWPMLYDKVHMSNIPDYVGGSLGTFIYALPVVQPGPACYATSNCLRNPPRFKNHSHYHNEYTGLSSPSDLKKVFQVRSHMEDWQLESPLALTEYMHYHHEPEELTSTSRMPREQFETWLFRLFLKLAMPKERELRNYALIYSPLNLTAFLRLCGHLHNVGYPAHWMSGVLDEICSGEITTKARPPRSEPLMIKEVKADLPALEQSTAPFVAELTTLLGMLQFALPFGVLSTHIPHIDLVRKYSITFESVSDFIAQPSHFVLVLFNVMYLSPEITTLRPYILSDELGDKSQKAARVRDNIHFITTWNWDADRKRADFWLRSDTMQALRATQAIIEPMLLLLIPDRHDSSTRNNRRGCTFSNICVVVGASKRRTLVENRLLLRLSAYNYDKSPALGWLRYVKNQPKSGNVCQTSATSHYACPPVVNFDTI